MSQASDRGGKAETNTVNVALPASLADRIRGRLPQSEFKSVDEYVTFVVEQVLTDLEANEAPTKQQEPFSKEDQASVEQRLRDLGYM